MKLIDKFPSYAVEILDRILRDGNSVEIKRERDNIVIVEIDRHVRAKIPIAEVRDSSNRG